MESHINGTWQPTVKTVTYNDHNVTDITSQNDEGNVQYYVLRTFLFGFILVVSSVGFLGNGTVIWLLGVRIRRNSFTTYILNLAVADFAFLLSLEFFYFVIFTEFHHIMHHIAVCLLDFTYNTGQLLLTAISIDRCVSVLFPIWHRCVRPTYLSTTVCALIWVVSCLLCVILNLLENIYAFPYIVSEAGQYFVTGLLCLPLMTISTVILFIKVCFKSHPRKQRRLLTVILLTLLFFLIFAFPLTAIFIALSIVEFKSPVEFYHGLLFASLNSSVNPLLYFLVGKKKGGRSRESLVVILQRVFNEEENDSQEVDPPCSCPLRSLP